MLHRFRSNRSRAGINMGAAAIFGTALGATFDNYALGIALGIALAVALDRRAASHRDNKEEHNE